MAMLLKQSLLRVHVALCEEHGAGYVRLGYQVPSAEASVFYSPLVALLKCCEQAQCTCGKDVKEE